MLLKSAESTHRNESVEGTDRLKNLITVYEIVMKLLFRIVAFSKIIYKFLIDWENNYCELT